MRRSARPSAKVRVLAPQHSPQHSPQRRSSSLASSAGPAAPAFKDQSATVRCPLLIGCAAASNQRLPLGLPGAHRLREGAGENKSGGQGPEGRGRATPREQLAGGAVGGALEMRGGRGSRLLIWAGRTRVLSRTLVRGYVCATLGDGGVGVGLKSEAAERPELVCWWERERTGLRSRLHVRGLFGLCLRE